MIELVEAGIPKIREIFTTAYGKFLKRHVEQFIVSENEFNPCRISNVHQSDLLHD